MRMGEITSLEATNKTKFKGLLLVASNICILKRRILF